MHDMLAISIAELVNIVIGGFGILLAAVSLVIAWWGLYPRVDTVVYGFLPEKTTPPERTGDLPSRSFVLMARGRHQLDVPQDKSITIPFELAVQVVPDSSPTLRFEVKDGKKLVLSGSRLHHRERYELRLRTEAEASLTPYSTMPGVRFESLADRRRVWRRTVVLLATITALLVMSGFTIVFGLIGDPDATWGRAALLVALVPATLGTYASYALSTP